jgi:xylose isomerase
MSGCAYQRTAAYVNNGNSYLNTYGSSLVTASSQYKDVYISSGDTQNGNYSANSSKMGDAIYETSTDAGMKLSWNSDESFMPYSNVPFFVRGGYSACADSAGVFAFNMSDGRVSLTCGFRPVLAVSDLL